MPESIVYNIDCMIGMKQYPDKYFDLAVVDPPYGIGANGMTMGLNNGTIIRSLHEWDSKPPTTAYFDELRRISVNYVVWGGNYFAQLWPCKCFLIWDKRQAKIPYRNMGDSELAATDLDDVCRTFRFIWDGFQKQGEKDTVKWHPTQKPVAIYDWIYKNYLPEGGKVIDTHLGSGSNRIAADKAGNIDFTGYELDKDYYEAQEKRWRNYKQQLTIF
jgi:site-specific DNA-methyltransferase (adenine-specific)